MLQVAADVGRIFAAVSSDFIVGFCGETEESFQKTCELVREARFKNSFIFKYSPRPGTRADDLYPDDVPEEIKKRRNNDLLAIQNAISLEEHRSRVGQTVTVLVEGRSRTTLKHGGPLQLTGRTQTDHIVVFDGNERLTGQEGPFVTIEQGLRGEGDRLFLLNGWNGYVTHPPAFHELIQRRDLDAYAQAGVTYLVASLRRATSPDDAERALDATAAALLTSE